MAIPLDLRLDHSGGHYRKHPSPLVDQIARTALVVDAASCHGLEYCFPPVTRLLEICAEPLLQREFLRPCNNRVAALEVGRGWVVVLPECESQFVVA